MRSLVCVCSEQRIYGRPGNGWGRDTRETGHHRQRSSIISIMRAPGRTSCSLRFFFDVMGSIAPPGLWYAQSKRSTTGRQWMGRDTRKNQVPSAKIIHPSYQQRGHQGRMSCSLRLFFDVMGNVAFPGSWSAQTYGSSTAGNKWDGTPGETGHHRQ